MLMKSLIKHSQIILIVIFLLFVIFLLNYWFSLYMNRGNSAHSSIIEGFSFLDKIKQQARDLVNREKQKQADAKQKAEDAELQRIRAEEEAAEVAAEMAQQQDFERISRELELTSETEKIIQQKQSMVDILQVQINKLIAQ